MMKKRKTGISLHKENFLPKKTVMLQLFQIGIPIAFQDGLIQIAFIIHNRSLRTARGLNDAAAVGIVEKVISFLFLVPSSMLSSVSALGAQNFGAGKPERAVETLKYAIMIAVGLALRCCGDPVCGRSGGEPFHR